MKMLKTLCTAAAAVAVMAASSASADETIKLGVSFFPFHSSDATQPDLLDAVSGELEAKGFDVEKVVFLNFAEANPALANEEIDGNLIQHELYMNIFNSRAGADLAIATPVYHATFAIYSGEYGSLDEIAEGETIYIPNDGVNTARALLLLQSAGLITLADGKTFDATVADVVENSKDLQFVETPLTTTAGAYDEGGRKLAVMYPTFARALDLTGDEERIFVEERNDVTNAYAVSFAVNSGDLEDDKTKAVIEALQSEAVVEFLRENYSWASTPAK